MARSGSKLPRRRRPSGASRIVLGGVYALAMFDALLPPIYKWLRRRAGLSQEKLAADLGAGRSSIYKFEHGTKRPSPAQEARLIELAGCSDEELGQRLRDGISEALDRPVGIVNEGRALAREARGRVSAAWLRALDNEIEAVEQAVLQLQRAKRNLQDLTRAVEEDMERKGSPADPGHWRFDVAREIGGSGTDEIYPGVD